MSKRVRWLKRVPFLCQLYSWYTRTINLMTSFFSRREDMKMPDWAEKYLASARVTNMNRDPAEYKVTRQSGVAVEGVLVPVKVEDERGLNNLFGLYRHSLQVLQLKAGLPSYGSFKGLTATMRAMLGRTAARTKKVPTSLDYISLDPRDFTVYTAPHVEVPVISIHTRPERCWFLGVVDMNIIGMKLGRMKVGKLTDQGVYPITIRTNWRALTNVKKLKEVKDAYQRLIQGSA